jgi:hypothetical protein
MATSAADEALQIRPHSDLMHPMGKELVDAGFTRLAGNTGLKILFIL